MTYQLIYPDSYIKRATKFLKKHPQLIKLYQESLELLELNPYHPSLKLHRLKGRLKNLCSISINISYRIAFVFEINNSLIILVNVGDHDAVY